MKTFRLYSVFLILLVAGCDFETLMPGMDEKFGHQHFASAVAVIELHKVRNGAYPPTLDDLEFLGDWDQIWMSTIEYERIADGYNLFVTRGWAGEPDLQLPERYRHGLGLRDSNVTWLAEK